MGTSPTSRSVLLVHRQLCDADLVVVRIDVKGEVLPPLIIFQDHDWDSDLFCQIITKESARMPLQIKVDFCEVKVDFWETEDDFWKVKDWQNTESRTCLHKYFGTNGYCVEDIQACVILPLNPKLNEFDFPLLNLLDLKSLLTTAWEMNDKWCSCKKSPEIDNMILCDNTGCNIGWYHMKCCGEVRDARLKDYKEWYCKKCQKLPKEERSKTTYDNDKSNEDIFQESDERIQRARTVYKVWEKHKWPKSDKILDCVGEIKWEHIIPIKKLEDTMNNKELRCRKILEGPRLS
jgi:hypothetical protein